MMSNEPPVEDWDAIHAAMLEQARRKRVRQEIENLHNNARLLADGTFDAGAEDLLHTYLMEQANVDVDHFNRGLFSSSVRLGHRRATRSKYWRGIFELRVRSMTSAYRTAKAIPTKEVVNRTHFELERLRREEEKRLADELELESTQTSIARENSYRVAAQRDLGHQHARACNLLRTEVAELELAFGVSKKSAQERGIEMSQSVREQMAKRAAIQKAQAHTAASTSPAATPAKESVVPSSNPQRPQEFADLTDADLDFLEALIKLKAVSEALRKTADQVAKVARNADEAGYAKARLPRLKKKGLVGAKRGTLGGYWILAQGQAAFEACRPKPKSQ